MGRKRLDLTGKKFGRLVVLSFSHLHKKNTMWKCLCECGNEIIVFGSSLTSGHTISCSGNYFYEEENYIVGILHDGNKFTIDKEDYNLIKDYKWYITEEGYVESSPGKLHRVILQANRNNIIDHINHNKLDNRKNNLRFCSKQQNTFNKLKCKENSTSKYKGVSLNAKLRKWVSQIQKDGKRIYLGVFKNEIDAAKAYNEAAIKYFGEFAWLNDI